MSVIFFYSMQHQWTISQLDWRVPKSGFYMTTGDNQLSSWNKKKLKSTSQSHTCTRKKVLVTVWWSAASLIHCSFLNPSETTASEKYTQQIDQRHQRKLQHLQPAMATERAHNNAWLHITQEPTGLRSFASFAIFTWSLTNWSPFIQAPSQLFAEKMLPQPAGCRKVFPRVHRILKHTFLCHGNKQTYFLLAKMCWL